MKLVNLPFFVDLGAGFKEMEDIADDAGVWSAYFPPIVLRDHIDTLLSGEHVQISASNHAARQLADEIFSFERRYFRSEDGQWLSPDQETKNDWVIYSLKTKSKEFKTILMAELRIATSFSVEPAGIFDAGQLVNYGHRALCSAVIEKFDDEILAEIDAAGKCFAFKLPTACGFHAMRAVERVIKIYLSSFFPQEEIKKMSNWGTYISSLEKALSDDGRQNKPNSESIALIRQIKDIYRNPVIHPERTLSMDESVTLFHSTIAAMNRLGMEIEPERLSLPQIISEVN